MKKYTQPKAGTPDALKTDATKLVNNKSNPAYIRRQNVLEAIKSYYKGDTSNNEWQ